MFSKLLSVQNFCDEMLKTCLMYSLLFSTSGIRDGLTLLRRDIIVTISKTVMTHLTLTLTWNQIF